MRAPSNPTHPLWFVIRLNFFFLIGYTEWLVKRTKKSHHPAVQPIFRRISWEGDKWSHRARNNAVGHRAQAAPDGSHGRLKSCTYVCTLIDRAYGISLFQWAENDVLMHILL